MNYDTLYFPVITIYQISVKDGCKPTSVHFMGKEITFPATVEEAVIHYNLDYKPPGFYFKILNQQHTELILTYHYNRSDFNNEYQPKETLYPRELNSYLFRFPEKKGLQDSLKTALEKEYGKKFLRKNGMDPSKTAMVQQYDFLFLDINPCLSIGLTSSPAYHKHDRKVNVRFFYNVSEKDRISAMGNYL